VSRAFAAVKEISYQAKLDLVCAQCGNVVLTGGSLLPSTVIRILTSPRLNPPTELYDLTPFLVTTTCHNCAPLERAQLSLVYIRLHGLGWQGYVTTPVTKADDFLLLPKKGPLNQER
jgi:hypothetical protein